VITVLKERKNNMDYKSEIENLKKEVESLKMTVDLIKKAEKLKYKGLTVEIDRLKEQIKRKE
tara:strand:+ start:530 stop:715 length:186 start_codon:yes stop_codon:yes gene_type:complete